MMGFFSETATMEQLVEYFSGHRKIQGSVKWEREWRAEWAKQNKDFSKWNPIVWYDKFGDDLFLDDEFDFYHKSRKYKIHKNRFELIGRLF